MTQTCCPHCQAKLRLSVDAFCPECRGRLDERPSARGETHSTPGDGSGGQFRSGHGVLMVIGGAFAQIPAVMALSRGDWPEAAYTGGVGFALIIGGLTWMRNRGGTEGAVNRRAYLRPLLVVVGCVIAVGLFIGASQLRRGQPQPVGADILGIAEPGDYRNPHFGFRVRYGANWQDVTGEMRKRTAEKARGGMGAGSVLLALARAPVGNQQSGASVIWAVEAIPESAGITSGANFLRRTLPRLQRRVDGPRDVKEERQTILAGLAFDGLSLRRPWGDRELKMRYWVAVKGKYALMITATYVSADDLKAIEALLARMGVTAGS